MFPSFAITALLNGSNVSEPGAGRVLRDQNELELLVIAAVLRVLTLFVVLASISSSSLRADR